VRALNEKYLHFGEYIKKKRKERELTIVEVSDYIGMAKSQYSDIENQRRPPFDGEKMELFAEFLNLSEEETALLFDIASNENRYVPYDLQEIFMYKEVGELARTALRISKECSEPEAEWKRLIREL
jgi:transcriptional regulator with XRE-family HTH domain